MAYLDLSLVVLNYQIKLELTPNPARRFCGQNQYQKYWLFSLGSIVNISIISTVYQAVYQALVLAFSSL